MVQCLRLALLVLLLSSTAAHAKEPDAVGAAKNHTESGEAFFKANKFAEARIEFLAAYELTKEADLLYNVALSYEREGLLREAADAYDRYLKAAPNDAVTREKVAKMRAQLAPAITAPTEPVAPKRGLPARKKAGIALIALGAASLVACIALGAVTERDRQALNSGTLTYGEAQATADRATTTRASAFAMGALGGLGVVVGVPLVVWR